MDRFVFVILHYITIDDTIECINSIKENINYCNYKIVVVDNGSPNNSGKKLLELYDNDNKVEIILSNENLGFSKGNNIGFEYSKSILNADYICVINNDTIIEQNDFINKCICKFTEEKYYVLGPDIISTIDGGHQNPYKANVYTYKSLKRDRILMNIYLYLNYLGIEKYTIKLRKKFSKSNSSVTNVRNNYVLHGSCMIFSPLYLQKYSKIGDYTFMYGEEDILFYICANLGLKYLYSDDLKIYHKESSATKKNLNNKSDKQLRFFYKNKLKSSKVLKNVITNYYGSIDSILR